MNTLLNPTTAILAQGEWEISGAFSVIQLLANTKLENVEPRLRAEVLALSAYVGAISSMFKGYFPIVHHLLATVRTLISTYMLECPVSYWVLKLQHAWYISYTDIDTARKEFQEIVNSDADPQLRSSAILQLEFLKNYSKDEGTMDMRKLFANVVIAGSTNLPVRRRVTLESVISKQPVQGAEFVLEDGKSVVTPSEALMWFRVNPFSPLSTGKWMNPF